MSGQGKRVITLTDEELYELELAILNRKKELQDRLKNFDESHQAYTDAAAWIVLCGSIMSKARAT